MSSQNKLLMEACELIEYYHDQTGDEWPERSHLKAWMINQKRALKKIINMKIMQLEADRKDSLENIAYIDECIQELKNIK